ncbi:hypothetical protein B0H16DRAFT_557407 [Mycena metata]|uniref:DUF7918 domain-containing protein n=1 Tax=Mycena metata TaxID=1033252 RepID=A0AAD7NG72_9AGAR|nr:hypothetical protein B0H16DRAFT_557407 [Mycena metata]
MLHFKEFSAWIMIEGKEAPEYDVQVSEDEKTVTCYIAAEIGKKFSVHWKNASYNQDTSGRVKTDGNACGGKILRCGSLPQVTSKHGVSENATSIRPFVFSPLELTDDDAFLAGSSYQLEKLGLIELTIVPVVVLGEMSRSTVNEHSIPDIKLHERSKKAVTQQVSLAEPAFRKPAPTNSTSRAGPDLVTFSFRYRPADVLRANGIMPPVPQPKRKASAELLRAQTPDDADVLAEAEEERNLRERLQALEAKRLKRETKPRVKSESDAVVDLTRTRDRKKVKLGGFVPGEVIDLT